MRILFANNLRGFYGGVEQVIQHYTRGLTRRGHECYFAYGEDARDPEVFVKPFLGHYACSQFCANTAGRPFDTILDEVKPDVVFFHKVTYLPPGLEHNNTVRKVRMVHDHDLWCPKGTGYFTHNRMTCHVAAGWRCYLDGAFLERNEGGLLPVKPTSVQAKIREMRRSHLFDAILVVSTYVHEQLVINGFPPERVHICNPILEHEDPDPTPVPEEPNVVYIGSLIRGKGVDLLLRALHKVKCPFHLDIVGTGKSEAQLRALSTELGLDDRVTFVGWVDHEEVPDYYRKAKVMAIPSCWPEPFTLVGQESMRHGRPVVAFNVGGNANWCDHEHTGFIVPEQDLTAYASALERLLTNTELAREMGQNGVRRVTERFSFEDYLDKVEHHLLGDA
jgi:glycosyltransferase involved in cell wall biosynthesis